jgi:hypothetical protein
MAKKFEPVDWPKLIDKIAQDSLAQRDEVVPVRSLEMRDAEAPYINFGNGNGERPFAALTKRSLKQLCETVGAPHNFIKKMTPELRARAINEFAEKNAESKQGERQVTLRLQRGEGNRDVVRAILPGQYSAVSNHTIANIARDIAVENKLEVANGGEGPRDGNWIIRLVDPTAGVDLGVRGEEDLTMPGFEIVHSEVGDSNLIGAPLTWQLWCTNGMGDWRPDKDSGINRVYRGLNEAMVIRDFGNAYTNCFTAAREVLDNMSKARNILLPVDECLEAIHKILAGAGLFKSKANFEQVCKNFEAAKKPYGAGASKKFSVHQVVTKMTEDAQQFDWINRRRLEKFAALFMEEKLISAAA